MATHSSILAWKIPWTEEPGGLQSVGSQGVGHDRPPERTHTSCLQTLYPPSCHSRAYLAEPHPGLNQLCLFCACPSKQRWVWRKPLSHAGCFPLVSGARFSHGSLRYLATIIHFPGPVTLPKTPSEFSHTFSSLLEPSASSPPSLSPADLVPIHGDDSSNQRTCFRPLPCLGMLVFCLPSC